jgi:competence protein ComEC
MKRPLTLLAIALVTGILTAHISNSPLFTIGLIIFLILITVFLSLSLRNRLVMLSIILAFYFIGAFEYFYIINSNESKYSKYMGEQVRVKGFVNSEPDIRDEKVIYIIKTKEIKCRNNVDKVSGKLLLTTLRGDNKYLYEYGEEIEVAGEINIPKGRRNPGGFDYKRYLMQSGISATIFARKENISIGSIKSINPIINYGNKIRNNIINIIYKSLPKDQAGLLSGMLIGYRKGLSKEIQEAFSDAGLMHTMAVSGAHVSFLIIPLLFIFRKLRAKKVISNVFIICILLMFLSITGFQPSVVRAVIMASLVLLGQIFWRESDVYTSISLAAIVLLICNPFNLFNVGFQLSFAATISIVMLHKSIKNIFTWKHMPSLIKDILSITISAQIGVLPITAFYFNKISLISIISNVLVTPLLQVVSILGYIMVITGQLSIGLSKLVGYLNCPLLTLILLVTKICSSFKFACIKVITPKVIFIITYYFIVWLILKYKSLKDMKIKRVTCFAVAVALIFMTFFLYIPLRRELEVIFLDVGSGDSAFVNVGGHTTMLIDGGGYRHADENKNIGDDIIIPFLLSYGVKKIDLVIATHGHDDHVQGLIPVLKDFLVGALVIPQTSAPDEFNDLIDICIDRDIDVIRCIRGDLIGIDKKTWCTVLNPSNTLNDMKGSLNNTSLVIKLSHLDMDFLFTGDIEKEAEVDILESGMDLECEVLKVSHHGSSTSTASSFLESVKPKAAVISVGSNNFGHPSQDVIERLNNRIVKVFRTDMDGAIIAKSNGKKIKLKKMIN